MSADAVLLEFEGEPADPATLEDALQTTAETLGGVPGGVAAFTALTEGRTACYLWGVDLRCCTPEALAKGAALVGREVEITRLENRKLSPGQSSGEIPTTHYVVRTDAAPGFDDELQRWYDEEHLAGLASVPGNVIARRFIALDHTPRYYACYELMSPDVLGSPAWLKVRGTAWSDRIRPQFRNTRRTLFRPLVARSPGASHA